MSAPAAFEKFSNLDGLKEAIANVPNGSISDDKQEILKQVEITDDSILIPAGPTGSVTLQLAEKIAPSIIRFNAVGLPIPLTITLHLDPVDDAHCNACASIEVEVPAMLRPMIAPMMNQLTEQISALFLRIPLE